MQNNKLTPIAQLADKVWRYLVFSGRFNNETAEDLREKYINPIFGNRISNEIKSFYVNQNE